MAHGFRLLLGLGLADPAAFPSHAFTDTTLNFHTLLTFQALTFYALTRT